MKYVSIVSCNSWFNYLVSRTYMLWKSVVIKKSKSNTAKMKELFLKLGHPIFDTYLTAILRISSKIESKYADVSFKWSLEVIT